MSFRVLFLLATTALITPYAADAGVLTNASPGVVYDFTGFTGSGFSPAPTAGQLNSNDIIVKGLSDGDMTFGDTRTSGDFALGTKAGAVNTGGVYAFDVGSGNIALGIQPGGSDFTPGSFIFGLENGGTTDITKVDFGFKVFVFNDQDRSNSLTPQFSLNGNNWFSFGSSASVVSPLGFDLFPSWNAAIDTTVSVFLNPGMIAPGEHFYFRFLGDDVSGSGNRDQFAVDNVSFSATFAPMTVPEPTTLAIWTMMIGGLAVRRRRRNGLSI